MITAERKEGAMRLVSYQRNPANPGAPLRTFTDIKERDLLTLKKTQLQGDVFRVDVERVEVGHWSLVAQRHPGRGKDKYVQLSNQGEG